MFLKQKTVTMTFTFIISLWKQRLFGHMSYHNEPSVYVAEHSKYPPTTPERVKGCIKSQVIVKEKQ